MPKPVVNALIPSPRWLMLYLACFIGCSVVFQLDPDAKPPSIDGSPIEYFTGTLLWVSSILSLVIAESGAAHVAYSGWRSARDSPCWRSMRSSAA